MSEHLPVVAINDFGDETVMGEDGNKYNISFTADWKASPDDVVESINKDLADRGINLQYTNLDNGSDTYLFGTKK